MWKDVVVVRTELILNERCLWEDNIENAPDVPVGKNT